MTRDDAMWRMILDDTQDLRRRISRLEGTTYAEPDEQPSPPRAKQGNVIPFPANRPT